MTLLSCGDPQSSSQPIVDPVNGDTAAPDRTGEDAADGSADLTALALTPPAGPTRAYTFPALGGVRFRAAESHHVYSYGDRVMIDPIGGIGAFDSGTAYVGLTTQGSDGSPIRTVDEFLARLDGIAAQPNGHSIELFGHRLIGYSTELVATGSRAESSLSLYGSSRLGSESRHTWAPDRDELFLADTPAGVLHVGYDHGGSPENPVAGGAFATLVSSAELTGPGLRSALPPGSIPAGGGPAPTPADVVDGGPPTLQAAFADVSPGTYQVPNVGHRLSIEITGWRVEPNQPGVVVLASPRSVGPGDDAIVFLGGLAPSLIPQSGGPTSGGDPVDLTDIRALLDDPPAGLVISNVTDVTVAGLAAIRFDARVADDATCAQDEPCEYAFGLTWAWNFTVAIQAELAHRIWWFPDHPTGVAMIHASDMNPRFLDRATDVVESAEALG